MLPRMRDEHLRYLHCVRCRGDLALENAERVANRVKKGTLRCQNCARAYQIRDHIPRFVEHDTSFGLQWNAHSRTQYDKSSGAPMSETRFLEETRWPQHLSGEIIIEAGSGSGRFTEQALSTGATVLSLDYSSAVEANYRSNGKHDNLLLVQGDLFHMPFPLGVAHRLFCFGVLQHTPDPQRALRSLVPHVRPGGEIVADIYAKTLVKYVLGTKYWVRPLTRRLSPTRLYRLTSWYVDVMWPVARLLRRIPKVGRALNWRLLIGDYSGQIADDDVLREWAKLDTFDMLSPEYDKPARLGSVRRWCAEMPLTDVRVHAGYNGYEIHARRAADDGGSGTHA